MTDLTPDEFDECMKEHIRQEFAAPPPGGYRSLFDPRPDHTRLLQDHVILRFPDLPKLSPGGIALEAKRYYGHAETGAVPRDATVVAVGPGAWQYVGGDGKRKRREVFHPTTLRVGDRVLIDAMHTQGGLYDEWDGERGDFRMVREGDVMGVLGADVRIEVA